MKICYCHTCDKHFRSLGIARHRAMHRDRREDCKITYTHGVTLLHNFSRLPHAEQTEPPEEK